ncbi:MAG: sulfotransferase family 2 domain-containing protein [Pseudomonadales bacterium]
MSAEPKFSILLVPYEAVYIDIAKNASSSLKAVFAKDLGLDLAATAGNSHLLDFPRPQPPDVSGARLYPELFTFAFVRNPWDRLVSCYRDKIRGEVSGFTRFSSAGIAHCLSGFTEFRAGMSFKAFANAVASIDDAVADEHFRSQHIHLVNDAGHIAIDYVGRYERLIDDFHWVTSTIGLPTRSLPRLQATTSAVDYRTNYDDQTREVVARRYARDIELFSYSFA